MQYQTQDTMKIVIPFFVLIALLSACSNNSNRKPSAVEKQATTVADTTILTSPDLTFFELHGNVDTLITEYDTLHFDRQGRLLTVNGMDPFQINKLEVMGDMFLEYTRTNGYITGENRMEGHVDYHWDKGQLTGSEWAAEGWTGRDTYHYNSNGLLISMTISQQEFGEQVEAITATYTYNSFDDHGNWTSRSINSNAPEGNTNETREIRYYK